MASRKKHNDEDAWRTPLTNVDALHKTVTDAFEQRLINDREIDRLVEQHIAPIKANTTEIMTMLRADTTIARRDANAFYKIWRRQQDAKEIMEEGDRDKILDDMRTLWAALMVGEMLDFIDVLDHTPSHVLLAQAAESESAAEEYAESNMPV